MLAAPSTQDEDVSSIPPTKDDAIDESENLSPKRTAKLASLLNCGTAEPLLRMLPNREKMNDTDEADANVSASDNRDASETLESESEKELDKPIESSDLSDPSRHIWIVTTAGLPWRTGTAVNPFLRAINFVKRRLSLYEEEAAADKEDGVILVEDEECDDEGADKKVGKVVLVIPWLESSNDAQKLYGSVVTKEGEEGKAQQLEWIRNYAIEQCDAAEEIKYLNIMFYPAAYWPAFGSIFPTADICSLVPRDEADVAILEEPEHLNWFRMPSLKSNTVSSYSGCDSVMSIIRRNDEELDNTAAVSDDLAADKGKESKDVVLPSSPTFDDEEEKKRVLGWAHKFTFVVGIIHTNYGAYMKQYGMGTSIIAAPAINSMSAMVVRAYCHQVIRLSGVIPSYANWKEKTSNVHGVRDEFLKKKSPLKIGQNSEKEEDQEEYAPVYFIGKLLWAKGFDRLLKVQEKFKHSNEKGEYFSIDIYGGGPDEISITRAFHGRNPNNHMGAEDTDERSTDGPGSDNDHLLGSFSEEESVMSKSSSIKDQLRALSKEESGKSTSQPYHDARHYINMGFEVDSADSYSYVLEQRQSDLDKSEKDPLSIIGHVSGKSLGTGIATSKAIKTLTDAAVKIGLSMTFTQEGKTNDASTADEAGDDLKTSPSYVFDPPKTLFELRRQAIPARFLGVKDHALIRDLPHKIFLNASITEVLCTTTAEALAMGKFVIIPDHPSNQFFLQFTNCLAYKSLAECVEKLQWALDNEPVPLTEEQAHIFTWDAATERLIEASTITKREANERTKAGRDKQDDRMAWLHSEGGKKGNLIKSLFKPDSNESKPEVKVLNE